MLLQDVFPSLLGKSYAEARISFDDAVLCGLLDTKTGQGQLNPSDDCLLETHHRLVFLSSTADVKPSKQVTACSSSCSIVVLLPVPLLSLYKKNYGSSESIVCQNLPVDWDMLAEFPLLSLSGFCIQRVCSFLTPREA